MAGLKVYRTAIGFHDAYVAAASQKAALKAWGSEKDLFGRGAAEVVTDPELTQEPLATPGKVIRRLRGTVDEQMAALPPDRPTPAAAAAKQPAAPKPRRAKPPKPRPSRAELDLAESRLDALADRHREQLAALAEREEALATERRKLLAAQQAEKASREQERDQAQGVYDRAIVAWRRG